METMQDQVLSLVRSKGVIRPHDLRELGMSPNNIYYLLNTGKLVRTGRGLYMLAHHDLTEHHTLAEAARVQKKGVVCLLSALSFHGLGTQQPYEVWMALPFGTHATKNKDVPIHPVAMSGESYEVGVIVQSIEGIDVKIYNIPKTVADCFKFRNKIGLDVTLEALREAIRERRCKREEIRQYAKVNRVEKVIRPYMESFSI